MGPVRLPNLAATLAALALWYGAYRVVVRPPQLHWGATAEEESRPLPGDDLVADPSLRANRAITIAGRAEDIWPWIVQIGYDRAGFYGYDLIENIGSKTGIRSARRIVPEFQRLAVGDRVYMSRIAYFKVGVLEPNRLLLWVDEAVPAQGAFTFALSPIDESHTRLLVRARMRFHWTDSRAPLDLFTEFGDHAAVPRMLLGIRDRVEHRRIQPLRWQAAEIAIWMITLAQFALAIFLILVRRSWWKPWIAAALAGSALLFVLYAREPMANGLVQLPVALAVAWARRAGAKEAT